MGEASLNMLMVEDSLADAELTVAELREYWPELTWKRVERAESFLAALAEEPDIIVCDYSLPGFSAPAAIKLLKESGKDIPLIVVTGQVGEEAAVNCVREGAADCLLKDRLVRLGEAVRSALEAKRLRLEQRRSAALLQASEERLRRIFDATQDAIMLFDYDEEQCLGRLVEANSAAGRMLGGGVERIIGLHASDFLRWGKNHGPQTGQELLAKGHLSCEATIITKSGAERAALLTGTVLDLGDAPVVMVLAHDLSERKRAALMLAQSELDREAFFEHCPEGIFRVNPRWILLDANPALAELLGHPDPALMAGLSLPRDVFADPDEADRLIKEIEHVGLIHNRIVKWRTEGGDLIEVLLSVQLLSEADGLAYQLVGFVRPVPEH